MSLNYLYLTNSTTVQSIKELLTRRGDEAVNKIQANLDKGTTATGKTKASVRYDVTEGSGKVTLSIIGGRAFFPAVETGSKPSDKNPSPEYVESIKDWMDARGKQGSPYGLAKGILKHGSKLWQKGGRTDIYTNVKNETIAIIAADLRQLGKKAILQKA